MGIVKGAAAQSNALYYPQADRYYPDGKMELYNKPIKIRKKRGKQFMELRYVIPNMEKTFGNLEFAGENKVEQRRNNGRMTVVSRSFNLYSDDRGQMILSWCCLLLLVRRTLNQRKK